MGMIIHTIKRYRMVITNGKGLRFSYMDRYNGLKIVRKIMRNMNMFWNFFNEMYFNISMQN